MVVCLGRMYDDWSPELYANKTFANTAKGIRSIDIVGKKTDRPTIAVRFVMEATGVYHEPLAYFLEEKGYEISIVLPNKISNYMRTLDVKTITDKHGFAGYCNVWIWKENWKSGRDLKRFTESLGS